MLVLNVDNLNCDNVYNKWYELVHQKGGRVATTDQDETVGRLYNLIE